LPWGTSMAYNFTKKKGKKSAANKAEAKKRSHGDSENEKSKDKETGKGEDKRLPPWLKKKK
jgi:hypothetical protein